MRPQSRNIKISQACEHCRSLKVRCQPSSTPGVCKKCVKSGHLSCKFVDKQPRPSRYRKVDSKARISELEKQLEEAIIKNRAVTESPTTIQIPDESAPSISHGPSMDPFSDFPKIDGRNSVPTVLNSRGITLQTAEQYMARFQTMTDFFPFVILPQNTFFLEMACSSPFLCLSAVCVASSSSMNIQEQIETVLRQTLLYRLTIDGDRDLDLLRALLVYLAWYHFFSTPKRDQSYMLIQLALGICADLGLDITPSEAISRPIGLRLEHYRKHSDNGKEDDFFSKDARRTYLGCHYLAMQNSIIFGKSNKISSTKYMLTCAQSLMDEPEQQSDELILPLITLQHHSVEYHNHLLMTHQAHQDLSSLAITRAHLEALLTKLSVCQADSHCTRTTPLIIEIASQFAQCHAQELGLVNPVARKMQADENPPKYDTTASSIRLEIMLRCFRSTLALVQLFLQIPPDKYTLLSSAQWLPIITSVVFLYKFCVGLPSVAEWDVQFARNAIDLGQFLETISGRLDIVLRNNSTLTDTERPSVLFILLSPIFDDAKKTWERVKDLSTEEVAMDQRKVHATEFSRRSIVNRAGHSIPNSYCPARSFWRNQGHGLELGTSNSGVDQLGDDMGENIFMRTSNDATWDDPLNDEIGEWDELNGVHFWDETSA